MTKSKWRGHDIYYDNRFMAWRYLKGHLFVQDDPDRECGHCGKPNTEKGYDGCIGHIPAVMNACCGHGRIKDMYVQFNDKTRIAGWRAYFWLRRRYLIGNRKRKLLERMGK